MDVGTPASGGKGNQASTDTTLDKQLLTYSFFPPKLGARLLKGLPALIRLSIIPATSLETLGPPRAPGPLNNGRRAGGGGDGEERKDGEGARGGGDGRERAGRMGALLSVGEWVFPPPRELPTLWSLAAKENLLAGL
jgi:hypothetical protein